MNYHLLDDMQLISLLKESDEQAFREIYVRYWQEIFLVAYKKVRSQPLAEELTQNLFVSLWKNRAADIHHLRSYLFNALKYSILNHIKSRLVREKYQHYQQAAADLRTDDADNLALLHDLVAALEKGIALLPAKTQAVFKLSRMEHRSVKEIARLLKISEKAVEYHITRSLKILRLYLKDHILF